MLLSNSSIDFSGSKEKIGFQVWRLVTVWQRQMNTMLTKHGITHSQYVVLESLLWISQEQDKVSQVMIAKHAQIEPMMVSVLLKSLQKKELIKRREDKKDTRSKSVELTSKGHFLVKKLLPEVEKFDAQFFSSIRVNTRLFEEMVGDLLHAAQEQEK